MAWIDGADRLPVRARVFSCGNVKVRLRRSRIWGCKVEFDRSSFFMAGMKVEDVLACSFSRWYPTLKKTTFRSVIVPLPQEFIDYLLADNLVLPKNATEGRRHVDEDDEDGWNDAENDTPALEAPNFEELDSVIASAMSELGGQAFIKLNWSSPRDASWILLNGSLKCHSPTDIYLLLKSSDFILHDLTQPFKDCLDQTDTSPSIKYELILRKWTDINPESEFRCFIRNKELVAISQRDDSQFYSLIGEQKDDIVRDIVSFFNEQIAHKFPLDNYVADVVRHRKDRVSLVDFNPYGPTTDSLLFDWDQEPLRPTGRPCIVETDRSRPEFRYITEDSGIRMNPLRNYCVPEDFLHLTTGQDPYKMLDLLNLRRSDRNHSSSSDDSD